MHPPFKLRPDSSTDHLQTQHEMKSARTPPHPSSISKRWMKKEIHSPDVTLASRRNLSWVLWPFHATTTVACMQPVTANQKPWDGDRPELARLGARRDRERRRLRGKRRAWIPAELAPGCCKTRREAVAAVPGRIRVSPSYALAGSTAIARACASSRSLALAAGVHTHTVRAYARAAPHRSIGGGALDVLVDASERARPADADGGQAIDARTAPTEPGRGEDSGVVAPA